MKWPFEKLFSLQALWGEGKKKERETSFSCSENQNNREVNKNRRDKSKSRQSVCLGAMEPKPVQEAKQRKQKKETTIATFSCRRTERGGGKKKGHEGQRVGGRDETSKAFRGSVIV